MLPLNNLLLPELPASDNPLKISNLLPPEAIVPDASFGDLLTANLIELTDPALPPGDARTAEELAAAAGAAVDRVLGALLELELQGWVRREPGPVYAR